jgi:hypothetical protein
VKAKQRCRVFGGEEKRPVAESTVLGEATTILQELVEVLRGIRAGMRGLEEAFDGHWVPVENDAEASDEEEGGESELDGELVGLSEEAADYRAFWRAKYGGEYRACWWRARMEGTCWRSWRRRRGRKEKRRRRRSRREMKGMRWRWMGWLRARQVSAD